MQYEDTSEWLTQDSSQDFKSMKTVKVDKNMHYGRGEKKKKKLSIHLPFKKKKRKSPDSCLNAISPAFVVEMRCEGGH